jgi:hypothetical protein
VKTLNTLICDWDLKWSGGERRQLPDAGIHVVLHAVCRRDAPRATPFTRPRSDALVLHAVSNQPAEDVARPISVEICFLQHN